MSSVIGTNAIKVDGRTLRSERTHKRIIDAVIQLVEEGNPHLRTAEIAERAEVSVRSIFQHFPDLEALYLSVADAQLRGILADLQPVRTDGDLEERVAALVSERAKLSERTLPMRKLAARFWPGPLTLVIPKKLTLPEAVSATDTVGVRVPDHPAARALLRAAGPMAVTSANLSGQPSPSSAGEVLAQLDGRIDLILDGGMTPGGVPSSVVDCTGSEPILLREGPIDLAAILSAL